MSSLANYTKENPSSASGPIHLERIRQTHVEMGNVYPTILPTDYYKNIIDRERVLEESGSNPWYVRPHHLETLTEHPYSLKDNVMDSNYYSYYSALERDFKGGYLSQEETDARQAPTETDNLISTLESQLQNLRSQLGSIEARRAESGDMERVPGGISSMMLQPYYDVPQDINYESKAKAYESVLDQLRNQERAILNQKREQEMEQFGAPHDRWYEDAGPNFAREMKKYDKIRDMGIQEREYIRKLGNNELY